MMRVRPSDFLRFAIDWRTAASVGQVARASFVLAVCAIPMTVALAAPRTPLVCRSSLSDGVLTLTLDNRDMTAWSILLRATPFEGMLSDNLKVLRDGKAVTYLGRLVKRGPPAQGDYWIAEGRTERTVTVAIGQFYDIAAPGDYSVRWRGTLLDARPIRIDSVDETRFQPKTLACPTHRFTVR